MRNIPYARSAAGRWTGVAGATNNHVDGLRWCETNCYTVSPLQMLRMAWTPRALRWLALPLAIGLTHVAFEDSADAKPKKSKSKSKKKTGPSMDDNAGRDVDEGGTAPGTTDSKASEIEVVETEKKKPKPGEPEPEAVTLEEEDAPVEATQEGPPSPFPLNWLSLTIQQDTLIYTDTANVCPSADQYGNETPGQAGYSCRDAEGVHKENVYTGAGNQVHGGLGLATLRINLGYDRVLASRIMLGARFGFLLFQAPGVTGSKAPKPFGGEARVAYYFGDAPFERDGFRPYSSFAVGYAQVDGKVSVDYYKDHVGYQTGKQGRLDVWRTTGPGFLALSGGASYPLGGFLLSGELRVQAMLGSFALAPALALTLGYGL